MAFAPKSWSPDMVRGPYRFDIERLRMVCGAVVALGIAGCASSLNRAPVEDRKFGATPMPSATVAVSAGGSSAASGAKPTLGAENAGKPGYYLVKAGDTLIRVGLETGQNWKDLIRWNNLENPNALEPGQVLRVVPPGADPNAVATRAVTIAKVETRPLDVQTRAASAPNSGIASIPASGGAVTPPAPVTSSVSPSPARGDDELNWQWPANGPVVAAFDETHSKGLAISGKVGDPVFAAADGRVVYAGSGLRGYGNLVILKHNSTYLTAYAHNQTLLVKEEQSVQRGQKIAEMGSIDAERVQLHFEIRKQGKPIDPARLLPSR